MSSPTEAAPAGGANADDAPPAKHQIGLIPCLAFSVGTMIGGGVFSLSGLVVDSAGPASILAYALAGLIMLFSALSFAAVSSRAKPGDSGYGPIADILGPVWRFIAMWGFYLNGVILIAFVLLSFGSYLNEYFVKGLGPLVAALLAVALLVVLNLGPADLVGKAETFLVGLKVGILLLLVAFGLARIGVGDFKPFSPNGPSAVASATAMLFTAYTGFNVVTNMAGSVKNAKRTVPLSIILSVLISAVIYMGVIVAMLASGQSDFGEAGLGKAADALMGKWGGLLVAFAACVSTLSAGNANVLGTSELMIRMASQGDIPPAAARTTKRGHPFVSVLLAGGVASVLLLTGSADMIASLSNVVAIAAMLVVDAAAFRLGWAAWKSPGMRLPGRITLPVLAFVTAIVQLPSLGGWNVLIGFGLMIVGLALFAARHKMHLGRGVLMELERLIKALETPVARALRRKTRDKKRPAAPVAASSDAGA